MPPDLEESQVTSAEEQMLQMLRTSLERQSAATEKLGADLLTAIAGLREEMQTTVADGHKSSLRTVLLLTVIGWGIIGAMVGVSLRLDGGAVNIGAAGEEAADELVAE